jgi:hypothetical protein
MYFPNNSTKTALQPLFIMLHENEKITTYSMLKFLLKVVLVVLAYSSLYNLWCVSKGSPYGLAKTFKITM